MHSSGGATRGRVLSAEGTGWGIKAFWGDYESARMGGVKVRIIHKPNKASHVFLAYPFYGASLRQVVEALDLQCSSNFALSHIPEETVVVAGLERSFAPLGAETADYVISTSRFARTGTWGKKSRRRVYALEADPRVRIQVGPISSISETSRLHVAAWLQETQRRGDASEESQLNIEAGFMQRVLKDPPGTPNLLGCVTQRDSEPLGFALFEKVVGSDTALGISFKTSRDVPGTNRLLRHVQCRTLDGLGIPYINVMDDGGVPGLREHKESLHPVKRVFKSALV